MNILSLMKNAKKMQAEFQKQQKELEGKLFVGEAGAGMVKVTLDGKHRAHKTEISADAMEDREVLEDLITAAINDACSKSSEAMRESMGGMSEMLGGADLGDLGDLFGGGNK